MLFDAASPGINGLMNREQSPLSFKVEWQNRKAVLQYTGYGFKDSKKLHKDTKKLLLCVRTWKSVGKQAEPSMSMELRAHAV